MAGVGEGIEDPELPRTQVPQNGDGEVEAASCLFPRVAPLSASRLNLSFKGLVEIMYISLIHIPGSGVIKHGHICMFS